MISIRNVSIVGAVVAASGALMWLSAQERPTFRVKVDMVVMSFTVTDSKNHYINGLKPNDFRIYEDGIVQKLNTFGEGNKPPVQVMENGQTRPLMATNPAAGETDPKAIAGGEIRSDAFVGTNVFVLFDTAIICTAASFMPPTPSRTSCAAWTGPTPSQSIRLAATYPAPAP